MLFCVCALSILTCSLFFSILCLFFFFKQKTAYEMRISDWSSDVLFRSRDWLWHGHGGRDCPAAGGHPAADRAQAHAQSGCQCRSLTCGAAAPQAATLDPHDLSSRVAPDRKSTRLNSSH